MSDTTTSPSLAHDTCSWSAGRAYPSIFHAERRETVKVSRGSRARKEISVKLPRELAKIEVNGLTRARALDVTRKRIKLLDRKVQGCRSEIASNLIFHFPDICI